MILGNMECLKETKIELTLPNSSGSLLGSTKVWGSSLNISCAPRETIAKITNKTMSSSYVIEGDMIGLHFIRFINRKGANNSSKSEI